MIDSALSGFHPERIPLPIPRSESRTGFAGTSRDPRSGRGRACRGRHWDAAVPATAKLKPYHYLLSEYVHHSWFLARPCRSVSYQSRKVSVPNSDPLCNWRRNNRSLTGAALFWKSAYVFVNRIIYQGALFVKKQGIRASRRKKKSLTGRVTEKSVFVFVDKINTEEEKC